MEAVIRCLLSLSLGIISLSAPVSAASFDCAHTTNARDRLICQTSTLSALDAQLGQIYQQKRAMLSPHGAELLQRSEQSWLRYVAVVCPMTPAPTVDLRAVPATCLQMRYQERLTELAQVAQKLGPFVFNRIDMFAAQPHAFSDQSGSVPGFYVQHLTYPQIDNVNSPAAAKWNKAYDKGDAGNGSGCESGMGNEITDYEISYANHRMTSVQLVEYEYCNGTPHGHFTVKAENLLWEKTSRALGPNDVFADGWETKLQQLFWKALLAKGWTPQDGSVEDEIKADVVEPSRWVFTQDGLSVSFSAYEGGCYACNPGTTTVPWDDLKPLLAPGSVVP
jgi:uncharacterized protein